MKSKIFSVLAILALLSVLVLPIVANATTMDENLTLTQDITDGIVVKSGSNVTLNLAGHNITNQGDHTITIEKGATLTITGSGNVTSTTHAKAVIFNEGTCIINNGTFSREETQEKAFYTVVNHGEMTINGGTIKISSDEAMESPSSIIDNGWFHDEENTEKIQAVLTINSGNIITEGFNNKYIKNDSFGTFIMNGGTITSGQKSSAAIYNADNNSILTINGGTINHTGNHNQPLWIGKGTLNLLGGVFNLSEDSLGICDPDIKNFLPKESDTKGFDEIDKDGKPTGNKIIAKEDDIKEKVESEEVKKEDVAEEEVKAVEEKATEVLKDYKVAGFFNVDLFKVCDTVKVDKIEEATNEVEVKIAVPETVEKVAEGYTRKYYVVRVHNGETTILDAILNDDGTISFKTDKFSTYSLVYVDTVAETPVVPAEKEELKNPKTGDAIIAIVAVFVLALAGIVITQIVKKNK